MCSEDTLLPIKISGVSVGVSRSEPAEARIGRDTCSTQLYRQRPHDRYERRHCINERRGLTNKLAITALLTHRPHELGCELYSSSQIVVELDKG